MAETGYHGVVRGSVVVLDEGTALAEGTEVLVTPVNVPRGSPSAVLAGLRKLAKVPREWVDESEQGIAEGRRPPSPPVLFPDDPTTQEEN